MASNSSSVLRSVVLRNQIVITRVRGGTTTSSSSLLFHTTTRNTLAGGHAPPPLPPFKRNPLPVQSLSENMDATWNDGVAPELALDFDLQNTSSSEALYTWFGAFGTIFLLYQGIKLVTTGEAGNPALNHSTDCVIPDYSQK